MRDGIDVRRVAGIGIAALIVLVVVVGAAAALTSRWDGTRPPGAAAPPDTWISGPVLETHPRADLADYLAAKQKLLDGYAWVDRQAGIARIPLDQAMRALAQGARP